MVQSTQNDGRKFVASGNSSKQLAHNASAANSGITSKFGTSSFTM